MNEPRIIQIIPADNWSAVFKVDGDDHYSPLICWALVEDESGFRSVVGMDDDGCFSEDVSNFVRYEKVREADDA